MQTTVNRKRQRQLRFEVMEDRRVLDCSSAVALTVSSETSAAINGQFAAGPESFCYSLQSVAEERYELRFTSTANSPFHFSISDSDGEPLPAFPPRIFNGPVTFEWTSTQTETLFIEIQDDFIDVIGEFTLDVRDEDFDDHGNTSDVATPIDVPASLNGRLETRTDQDRFSFEATKGTLYTIQLRGVSGSTVSPLVAVFSEDESRPTYIRSSNLIHWIAPSNGKAFIDVKGTGTTSFLRYKYLLSVLVPEYDDDHGNHPDFATPIDVTDEVAGQLEVPGDHDVFSFVAQAGVHYTIHSTANVRAQDSSGEAVGRTWIPTATQTYAIVVTTQGDETGEFSFHITSRPAVDEHGDTFQAATAMEVPQTVFGSFESASDIDVFQFEAVAGLTYLFEIEPVAGGGSVEWRVFRAPARVTHQPLTLATNKYFTDIGDRVRDYFTWEPSESGTYFLAGSKFQATAGVLNYGLTSNSFIDSGDTFEDATPLAVPSLTQSAFEFPGDRDYFSFEATQGVLYNLAFAMAPSHSAYIVFTNQESFLEVQFELPSDTNGVSWFAPATGTYYFMVFAPPYNWTDTPLNYQLEIEIPRNDDPISCDFVQLGPESFRRLDGCDLDDLQQLHVESRNHTIPLTLERITRWLEAASARDPNLDYVVGDIDLDGNVDTNDLGSLLNLFGFREFLPNTPNVDLNGDAIIDSADLGLLLNNFGFESGPTDATVAGANLAAPASRERTDVNWDGHVSPLDALQVINRLNGTAEEIDLRFDVNYDGSVTPLDALLVINRLNEQAIQINATLFDSKDADEDDAINRQSLADSVFQSL